MEHEDAYKEAAAHEMAIEKLRRRLDLISLSNDDNKDHNNNSIVFPRCLACSTPIESPEGVGNVYRLDSDIFQTQRTYLLCVWCKETVLWNEMRTQFLTKIKLKSFDLFTDDDQEEE